RDGELVPVEEEDIVVVIYKDGKFAPIAPEHISKGRFNAQRDRLLIEKGSHFYCQTCLVAVPITEQSKDERYCLGCHSSIKGG
ncbi:MAG: hypothetical protein Q8O55_09705, partial [Dehalococcoidales bacterium]|nr:hypothetical protein [Dehalococcoidales bacterium]